MLRLSWLGRWGLPVLTVCTLLTAIVFGRRPLPPRPRPAR